jgi:hypothetical protein
MTESAGSLDGFPSRFFAAYLETGEEKSGRKNAEMTSLRIARFNQRFLNRFYFHRFLPLHQNTTRDSRPNLRLIVPFA